MNDYEARQEARRERYLDRAEKAEEKRDAYLDRAKQMSSVIPFGQPILVGHHSEKADRRYRDRIHNTEGRGWAEHDKAEHYRQKAASVGKGGISSDDPEAVDKLREELAKLERKQEQMKQVNALVRKNDRAGLAAMGCSEGTIEQLFTPDFMGRVGFPDYAIKNNNANIRRIRERIEHLGKQAQTPTREPIEGDGFTISDDPDENRVMIEFDAIPPAELRARLKHNGFKWSPTRGAWVRMRSDSTWYLARSLMGVA